MAKPALTGSRIRQFRVDRGIRQADLARECGISPSYLNLIEHNRRKIAGALLNAVAARLEVDPSALSEGAGPALTGALEAAAGADEGLGVDVERTEDFAGRFPGWAQLVVRQRARVSELERLVQSLNDRMTHDPLLSASLHNVLSTVTAIRSASGILAAGESIEPEWQARFHRNLYEDSQRLADAAEGLVGYLDSEDDADRTVALPQDELEAWLEEHDWRFEVLEGSDPGSPERLIEGASDKLPSQAARDLALSFLVRYRNDASELPSERLLEAVRQGIQDPVKLAARFELDLPLVMRRLATLSSDAFRGGLPPGLVVCDGSGTLTYRKPVHGFDPPRFGAACAVWPLFQALHRPMAPVRSELLMAGQDNVRFSACAIATSDYVAGFDRPPVVESTMLLMPNLSTEGTNGSGFAVGSSCRICPISDCPARRERSILESHMASEI